MYNETNYWQKYYKKNRDKILAKNRKWYKEATPEQKEKINIRGVKWAKKNRQKVNLYQKNVYKNKRLEVIKLLGGKCKKCGYKDWRALQVDHVNGGGVKELKKISRPTYYSQILNSAETGKFQLLCANCNWIKKYENNEY